MSIEVKKSRKPWVVFTSPRDAFHESGTGYGMLVNTNNASPDELPYEVMMRKHPASSGDRLGRTLYVAFSNAENGSAYGAAVSACKAAHASHRQAAKRMETDDWRGDSVDVTFYCPVVVLDGQLHECHLDASGEPLLREASHATLSLNYLSPAYGDRTYLVDIVTTAYVTEYSRSHHEWLCDMRAHIVQTVRR